LSKNAISDEIFGKTSDTNRLRPIPTNVQKYREKVSQICQKQKIINNFFGSLHLPEYVYKME
jgi:hypothetical protein